MADMSVEPPSILALFVKMSACRVPESWGTISFGSAVVCTCRAGVCGTQHNCAQEIMNASRRRPIEVPGPGDSTPPVSRLRRVIPPEMARDPNLLLGFSASLLGTRTPRKPSFSLPGRRCRCTSQAAPRSSRGSTGDRPQTEGVDRWTPEAMFPTRVRDFPSRPRRSTA